MSEAADTPAAPDVAGGVEEDEHAAACVREDDHPGACLAPFRPTPPPQPAEREASTGAQRAACDACDGSCGVCPYASTGAPEQDEAATEREAQRRRDNLPCSVCGGDRLRPDFTGERKGCHVGSAPAGGRRMDKLGTIWACACGNTKRIPEEERDV